MTEQNDYKYTDGLSSRRLRTRFLEMSDVAAWSGFFKDPEAVALFPATFLPTDVDPALPWIERQMQRYRESLFGLQAILNKTSGEFLGQCGLLTQEVDGVRELEVGYHFFKRHWGNGYAPEAAKLFIDYAFKNRLSDSVISIINVKNTKSQRVAEKNGLAIEKRTTWRDTDVYIYRVFKT